MRCMGDERMTITTVDDQLMFQTKQGLLSMADMAKMIRLQAGYSTIGQFEIAMGIDHPRWYHLERGKWSTPRLLLEVMCQLGYTITITREGQ